VIATGGTIASTATDGGVVATRSAADLLDSAHVTGIEIESLDLMTVGSYCMTLQNLRTISDAVTGLLNRRTDSVDGIVITHGTDTMEETAILLDLIHDDPRPVILTGAQRASDALDSDGPQNLADAVLVAGTSESRDLGVLIVFAGRILPARATRKMHTAALAAFASASGTNVGDVIDGNVTVNSIPKRPNPLPPPTETFDRIRIDLVTMYPGADGTFLRAAAVAGAQGIVLAGTGIGNANPQVVDAASELLASDVAVVLSTRVSEGPVAGVYGNGGGADLVSLGIPLASGLPATQLRILLALWLSQHSFDASQVRSMIETYADNKED
jgi:L-asparaginase